MDAMVEEAKIIRELTRGVVAQCVAGVISLVDALNDDGLKKAAKRALGDKSALNVCLIRKPNPGEREILQDFLNLCEFLEKDVIAA